MKFDKLFLIHVSLPKRSDYDTLFEVIKENYISKQLNDTSIFIAAPNEENTTGVFEKITGKISKSLDSSDILIVQVTKFHANMPESVWDWIESKTTVSMKG